jgi:hypothetical protein
MARKRRYQCKSRALRSLGSPFVFVNTGISGLTRSAGSLWPDGGEGRCWKPRPGRDTIAGLDAKRTRGVRRVFQGPHEVCKGQADIAIFNGVDVNQGAGRWPAPSRE